MPSKMRSRRPGLKKHETGNGRRWTHRELGSARWRFASTVGRRVGAIARTPSPQMSPREAGSRRRPARSPSVSSSALVVLPDAVVALKAHAAREKGTDSLVDAVYLEV